MATSLVIEEDHGTWTGNVHPHNGYYAGDFAFRIAAPVAAGGKALPCGMESSLNRPALSGGRVSGTAESSPA